MVNYNVVQKENNFKIISLGDSVNIWMNIFEKIAKENFVNFFVEIYNKKVKVKV